MTFKLGNFFPKKIVNEPGLDLDDPRWKELEGGYKGSPYDAAIALKLLEQAKTIEEINNIYKTLWEELHHQGDVGIASYYAVPHLVRIAKANQLLDYNVFGLVSIIEIQRHKNNPQLPKALSPAYQDSIVDLAELAKLAIGQEWSFDLTSTALTAIALAKGQLKLAEAIFNLDSDDRIDEFLASC
jgi:hypothetical protein